MNAYTFTPAQVLAFLAGMPLPERIKINSAEEIIDLPLYISTQCSRMYCGCWLLEEQALERMARLARALEYYSHHKNAQK